MISAQSSYDLYCYLLNTTFSFQFSGFSSPSFILSSNSGESMGLMCCFVPNPDHKFVTIKNKKCIPTQHLKEQVWHLCHLGGPWDDAGKLPVTLLPCHCSAPYLLPRRPKFSQDSGAPEPGLAHSHVEKVEADAVEPFAQSVGGERGRLAAGRVLAVVARQAQDHGLQGLLGG